MSTGMTGMAGMAIQKKYPWVCFQFERGRCLVQLQKVRIDWNRRLISIHFTHIQHHSQDECFRSILTVKFIPVSECSFLAGLSRVIIQYLQRGDTRPTRYWLYSHRNRPLGLEHVLKVCAARANSRQRKVAMPAERTSCSSSSSASSSGETAPARGLCG